MIYLSENSLYLWTLGTVKSRRCTSPFQMGLRMTTLIFNNCVSFSCELRMLIFTWNQLSHQKTQWNLCLAFPKQNNPIWWTRQYKAAFNGTIITYSGTNTRRNVELKKSPSRRRGRIWKEALISLKLYKLSADVAKLKVT